MKNENKTKPESNHSHPPHSSSHSDHGCCGSHGDLSASGAETPADVLRNGVLDVRTLPPARRHSLIFQTFEELRPGTSFVLVNDHDPKPLYYQFAYEKAGGFSWNYEEQGPDVWRVRIGKTDVQTALKGPSAVAH